MIVGVFSEGNIATVILGAVTVALGIALLRWRRPFVRAITKAQLRSGTQRAETGHNPWAAVAVGVLWIAMGTLALLSGLTDGFGTRD